MPIEFKEDYSAPVTEKDIHQVLNQDDKRNGKKMIVDKILILLNEKRDSYQGILKSILYIIDTKDVEFIEILKHGLIRSIVSKPMAYSGKVFLNKVLFRLTNKQPSFVIDLFDDIISNSPVWSINFSESREILRLQIISLKAIRKAEQINEEKSTLLSNDKVESICDNAIKICDETTKIDTLSLVIDSKKSTKPVDLREIELYKIIFSDAIRLQNPALRQIFIALTNKFINRLFASYRVVLRNTKIFHDKETQALFDRYRSFLVYIIEFCLDNIYCNAYFGTFVLTISTLKIITDYIRDFGDLFEIEKLIGSKRAYDSILSCINDSFEQNKIIALDLILSLPYNEEFINDSNLKLFEKIAFELVASVNPAHSLTCQYMFKLIIGLKFIQKVSSKTRNQLLLEQLEKLVSIVEESVRETKDNFIYALKSKPIYPKLTCIRALLDDIDIMTIEEDRKDWEKLAKSILNLSIDACKSVSTIVCNLNPETIGHLPMDLKPIDIELLAKSLNVSLNISDNDLNTITSQMLLISGWKTVKECSLSMGAICNLFWWPKELIRKKKEKNPGFKTKPFLDNNDIIRIVEFFDYYLKNLRHRGAFEQAYNGFLMVTKRVWHDEQLRDLLIKTLMSIMNDFKNEALDENKAKYLKAYITRRSAGLPFIVQAILTSEHRHDSKTLRWTMNCLFEIIENKNTETYQQIHCLNILIALIKEHNLGEKVLPFVGKTLAITMNSFKSESFPVRNCANMLMKAVVDRIFGVNRLRDDIHRRNQLSFKKFFDKCPELHSEMLKHLMDGIKDKRCLVTIHSVYIILFRLIGTSNLDYNKLVEPFLEPILSLVFKCPDLKLRELSAKLILKLEKLREDGDALKSREKFYKSLIESIIFNNTSKIVNNNQLHGALVLTKFWVEDSTSFIDFGIKIVIFILKLVNIPSSILYFTMELAESCCIENKDSTNRWLIELTDLILDQVLRKEKSREAYFENFVFHTITSLLINSFNLEETNDSQNQCDKVINLLFKIITLESNSYYSIDLQASLIRLLRHILSDSSHENINDLIEQLDMDSLASFITPFDRLRASYGNNNNNSSTNDKLIKYCSNTNLQNYLKKFITNNKQLFDLNTYSEFKLEENKYHINSTNTLRGIELLAINYMLWDDKLFLREIHNKDDAIIKFKFMVDLIAKLSDCDIKCLALVFTGKLINYLIKNKLYLYEQFEYFSRILENHSIGDNSLTIRISCLKVLQLCFKEIIQTKDSKFNCFIKHLVVSLVNLCQDEDPEIRSISQNIIISSNNINTKLSNSYLNNNCSISNWLNCLIKLVVFEVFNPNQIQDVNYCLELMLRFIIDIEDNCYENNEFEDKESLFDRTKLNDFADSTQIVEASLSALEIFFKQMKDNNQQFTDLNSLKFSDDILKQLKTIESIKMDNNMTYGDYSVNNKTDDLNINNKFEDYKKEFTTNEEYFENLIESILKSLEYFEYGYENLLLDTFYTNQELFLFKNIAMLRFITKCTRYNSSIEILIEEVKIKIKQLNGKCCSTTLLDKCYKIMFHD